MGGLAIVSGFLVTVLIILPFLPELRTIQFVGFVGGMVIIVLLGMLDDVYTLSAKYKLLIQIIAALIVISTGTAIHVELPFIELSGRLDAPVTLVWIIGVTNAVNLIDGVDGLAAGVSAISALCIMALCLMGENYMAAVYTTLLAGSCLGFLPRNFSPAEIIMGDTGSTFLGFVLAVSSILGVYKSYAVLSVAIAMLALALPIFDTVFAMLRRALSGKPIMEADRGHLHHRLIDSGYSHKKAVVLLYLISAVAAALAILIAIHNAATAVAIIASIVIGLMMIFIYNKRLDKK